jgi:hypothetical protein
MIKKGKIILITAAFLLALPALALSSTGETRSDITDIEKAVVMKTYGRLPLYFIENNGQEDERMLFYEKGRGHATFFTREGVFLSMIKNQESQDKEHREKAEDPNPKSEIADLKYTIIKLTPVGANEEPEVVAEGLQEYKVNFFIGNDPERWRTSVPTYMAVLYKDVYKGIDIKYYGNNSQLEYDIIVKPGADPQIVKLSYEGIQGLEVTDEGVLEISLKEGKLIQKKPYIYQEIEGRRVEVEGKFKVQNSELKVKNSELRNPRPDLGSKALNSEMIYGFEVASYNKAYPLIIDPVLLYSTYLGGNGYEGGSDIAVDANGQVYITGYTTSTNFPTKNPSQGTNAGGYDAFVTKIDSTGSALLYSTYLGGSGDDYGFGIDVDVSGQVYITGYTDSTNFPTESPIQGTNAGGNDAFVTKIDSAGSALLYSTYLGGSGNDYGMGIAVPNDEAYIIGRTASTNFPTKNPFQGANAGGYDVFVTNIDSAGSALIGSTYLGGSGQDYGRNIDLEVYHSIYIIGYTKSTDFPTKNPIQGTNAGGYDVFVAQLSISIHSISLYDSTYLGGSGDDKGFDIALIRGSSDPHITGSTNSTDFPIRWPIQSFNAGGYDAFIAELSPGLYLDFSTYLGGSGDDYGTGISGYNNPYITGYTNSTDFPTKYPFQGTNAGGNDAFVTQLTTGFYSSLQYSTYLGGSGGDYGKGIAVDDSGYAYITGDTFSSNFPTQSPVQGTNAGAGDAFVTKTIPDPDLIVLSITKNPSIPVPGQDVSITVTFKNQGSGTTRNSFYVDFYKDRASAPAPYQRGDFSCSIASLAAGAQNTCAGTVSYAADGSYKMWAQVDTDQQVAETDENNNVYGPNTVNVDGTPPSGTISINSGAAYTTSTSVTLNLSCTDAKSGCDQMQFSNNNATWSLWEVYAASKAWTLSSGDGIKTVYVRYKDKVGNISSSFSDDIIFDTTPPIDGTLTATPGDGQVSLSWSGFSDALSGLRPTNTYKVMRDSGVFPDSYCTSGTQVYLGSGNSTTDTGLTNGITYYYIACAYDNANNISQGAIASATPSSLSYTLSVTKAGPGSGTVTSSPAGIDCGLDCSEPYTSGTIVTLTATPDVGSVFAGWSGDADCSDGAVTMYSDKTCTATFDLQTYTLSVTKAGPGSGTVTSSPAGIDCGLDCSEPYTNGTVVTLTATPDAGYYFGGWTGCDSPSENICTMTMDSDKTVTANFTTWIIEIVDSEGNVGFSTSIAIDSSGKAHISYRDGTNYALKYASNASGSWVTETVDINVGKYGSILSSIAIDSSGFIHISYYDDWPDGDLRYATNASGSWVIETVDTGSTGWGGRSIAIDSSDNVHIGYFGGYKDLKYATNTSGSWVIETVDWYGDVGRNPSIAIDSLDKVHISYLDFTNYDLKYATNASGSWVTETVDSAGNVGEFTSIAIDSSDNVHISYADRNNDDLKHAANASGSWVTETVDSIGQVALFSISIAIDSLDKMHISYNDYTNRDVKYATNVSGTWSTEIVNGAGKVVGGSSIAIDSSDNVHISYSDYTNYDLKYATNAPPAPSPDIKANGSDGPVTITQSDNLSVTVELDAGDNSGENADWWVVADTPFGWYYYNLSTGWQPGITCTYQGPLFDLSPFEVLNMSGLPVGCYTFYFGVDLNMNCVIDSPIYYWSVYVCITP